MFALEFLGIWGFLLIISWLITGTSIDALYITGLILAAVPIFVVLFIIDNKKLRQQEDELRRREDYLRAYNDGYYNCLRKIKQDETKK